MEYRHSQEKPRLKEAFANEGFVEYAEQGRTATAVLAPDDRWLETIERQRNRNKKQIDETSYRLGLHPKSAWDEDDGNSVTDQAQHHGGGEENRVQEYETSTDISSSPPFDVGDNLKTMVNYLEQNMKLASNYVHQWNALNQRAEKETLNAHAEVERQKEILKEVIDVYSRTLHADLDQQLTTFRLESKMATDRLEEALKSMKNIYETRSDSKDLQRQAMQDHLLTWVTECDAMKAPLKLPLTFNISDERRQQEVIEKLMSTCHSRRFHGDKRCRETAPYPPPPHQVSLGGSAQRVQSFVQEFTHATPIKEKSQGSPSSFGIMNKNLGSCKKQGPRGKVRDHCDSLRDEFRIRAVPQLIRTFSCRLGKDKRICGVTDVTLTDDNEVFVIDKHNKAVKMFDSNGVLLKFFVKKEIRKPSRISNLCSKNQFLITDEANNRVAVFSKDGQFQSQLECLQHPVSHCQMTDEHVAILEFSKKSVVICNMNGKIVSEFSTNLECPAYLACTKFGHIAVTDWKSGSLKI